MKLVEATADEATNYVRVLVLVHGQAVGLNVDAAINKQPRQLQLSFMSTDLQTALTHSLLPRPLSLSDPVTQSHTSLLFISLSPVSS